MINRTVLVGRITHDPEVKKTNNGSSVVNFSLAVNRQFNRDQTDFINCVAWRNQADFIGNYIKKGALLGIDGRIETGSYEDQTGRKVNTFTVVCESVQALEPRGQRNTGGYQQQDTGFQQQEPPAFSQPASAPKFESDDYEDDAPTLDITNDDLPF